jgi:hypothetical protein
MPGNYLINLSFRHESQDRLQWKCKGAAVLISSVMASLFNTSWRNPLLAVISGVLLHNIVLLFQLDVILQRIIY